MDRADAVERRREEAGAELLGRPKPRLNRLEIDAWGGGGQGCAHARVAG
jgi:hypothetical protein